MTQSTSQSSPPILAALGTPKQRFESMVGDKGDLLLGLFFAVVGLFLLYQTYITSIDESNESTSFILGFATIGAFVAACFMIQLWWKNHGLYVDLYSDGLVRVKGKKVQEVRWDDIESVWQSITKHYRNFIYTHTTYFYTIQTTDKTIITIDKTIKGIDQLGQTIQNESTKRLLPKMIAAYHAGQVVSFGPLTLSKERVQYLNNYVSWTELEDVQLVKGFVIFKNYDKRFDWANVAASEIPNLFVFLSLIDHVVGLKSGR